MGAAGDAPLSHIPWSDGRHKVQCSFLNFFRQDIEYEVIKAEWYTKFHTQLILLKSV